MSTTSVPSQIASPFPRKKKTMKLFYHLLSDMRHQRVAVISLAVGQVVNIFTFCDFHCFTATNIYWFSGFIDTLIGFRAFCIIFGMFGINSC